MQLNYGPFSSSKNLRRLCRAEVHLQSHDFVVCRGAFSRPPRKSHLSGQPQPFRCWYHVVTIGTRLRAFTKKKHKSLGAKLLLTLATIQKTPFNITGSLKPRWWVWWALLIQGETQKCLFFHVRPRFQHGLTSDICIKFQKKRTSKKRCVTAFIKYISYI